VGYVLRNRPSPSSEQKLYYTAKAFTHLKEAVESANIKRTEKWFGVVTTYEPLCAGALLEYAIAYEQANRGKDGAAEFLAAILSKGKEVMDKQWDSMIAKNLCQVGQRWMNFHDEDRALEYFKLSLKLDPGNVQAKDEFQNIRVRQFMEHRAMA
jgi:tetratricopeptide (TPR) repeat protein